MSLIHLVQRIIYSLFFFSCIRGRGNHPVAKWQLMQVPTCVGSFFIVTVCCVRSHLRQVFLCAVIDRISVCTAPCEVLQSKATPISHWTMTGCLFLARMGHPATICFIRCGYIYKTMSQPLFAKKRKLRNYYFYHIPFFRHRRESYKGNIVFLELIFHFLKVCM